MHKRPGCRFHKYLSQVFTLSARRTQKLLGTLGTSDAWAHNSGSFNICAAIYACLWIYPGEINFARHKMKLKWKMEVYEPLKRRFLLFVSFSVVRKTPDANGILKCLCVSATLLCELWCAFSLFHRGMIALATFIWQFCAWITAQKLPALFTRPTKL